MGQVGGKGKYLLPYNTHQLLHPSYAAFTISLLSSCSFFLFPGWPGIHAVPAQAEEGHTHAAYARSEALHIHAANTHVIHTHAVHTQVKQILFYVSFNSGMPLLLQNSN
jgi:hypothetical protein